MYIMSNNGYYPITLIYHLSNGQDETSLPLVTACQEDERILSRAGPIPWFAQAELDPS